LVDILSLLKYPPNELGLDGIESAEMGVLRLIVSGATAIEIAEELGVAGRRVRGIQRQVINLLRDPKVLPAAAEQLGIADAVDQLGIFRSCPAC